MNKKKWVGMLMTVSLVNGATQNYALCYDDIVDILNTEEVNKIELQQGCTAAECARHLLRIQLDTTVASAIAPRIRAILERHNNEKAIEELGKIEKEFNRIEKDFSKKEGKEFLKYQLIEKLLNITVGEKEEYMMTGFDGYSDAVPATIKIPFKEDKELLKELITFTATEEKVLNQYREYDTKMKKIEDDLKEIIRKKDFSITEINGKLREALGCVKEQYSTPAGYIRYLAARGYFLDKSSFPGMSEDTYKEDILPWYYVSKVPSIAVNLALDKGTDLLGVPDLIMYPAKNLLKPSVNTFGKSLNESLMYLLINQDPHLSSLYKFSTLNETDILDSFDLKEYASNTAQDVMKKAIGVENPPEPINTVNSILSASN